MKNEYHKNLDKLKSVLVGDYQQRLAKRLDGIDISQIKKAFAGILKNQDLLKQICTEAVKMAQEEVGEKRNISNQVDDILKLAANN